MSQLEFGIGGWPPISTQVRVNATELSVYRNQHRLIGTHSRAMGVGNKNATNMHIEPVGDPKFWQKCIINICVNLLLICVHEGFLYLENIVSIDTQLVVKITGLSSAGECPLPLFMDKTQEKALAERMKEKYGTHRAVHGLDVARINDDSFSFVTKVLACKLIKKCHRDHVST
jgi:hypothetical protein